MKKIYAILYLSAISAISFAQLNCQAGFSYSANNLTVQFTDASTGNGAVISWSWQFGDGNASTQQNPSYTYTSNGSYMVCLTITDMMACSSTFCDTITVTGGGTGSNCTASFISSVSGNTATFTDGSTGNITSWLWDFGDGNTSTLQNPFNTYANNGSYIVCLTIYDSLTCSNTSCDTITISSGTGTNCQAAFTSVVNGFSTSFTDGSTGNITSWMWDFGDGGVSTVQNPTWQYSIAGTYMVCLTVSDSAICTSTYCDTITISGGTGTNCQAAFTSVISGFSASFTDGSTGNITSWLWDFGDGNTSTLQNPSNTYANNGSYLVCLTISDSGCTSTYCDTITISGGTGTNCQAAFTSVVSGFSASFTDGSTGNITSWMWDFGDGGVSYLQNPIWQYSIAGTYMVCLTVNDFGCTSTYCDTITISGGTGICLDPSVIDSSMGCLTIYDPVCGCDSITYNNSCEAYYYYGITSWTSGACGSSNVCTANFSYSINGTIVTFTNNSTGNYTSVLWDFGDGTTSTQTNPTHTYQIAGYYNVCLTVYDSTQNCNSTFCDYLQAGSTGSCTAGFFYMPDSSNIMTVNFTDMSSGNPNSWLWDFGDGTTSTQQNPSHTYAYFGSYYVCLTISDSASGCYDTYCEYVLVGNQTGNCYASFGYSPDSSNQNTIDFMDYSCCNIISWLWDFGDGNISSQQNPSHTYNAPGYYNVCLTVTDSTQTCTDSMCMSVYIDSTTTGNCWASFGYYPDSSSNNVINFFDLSLQNASTWMWDFGDGSTSTQQNPIHSFAPGTYYVCLTITDGANCTATFCDNVYIAPSQAGNCTAVFTYSNNGNSYSFTDASTGGVTSWFWDFGDGNTSTQQNPSNTYANAGAYLVCLTASDSLGCFDVACDTITIYPTGIEEFSQEKFSIYPNPSKGVVELRIENEKLRNAAATIYNMLGKMVYQTNINQQSTIINLQFLSDGVYFIGIEADNMMIYKRVVIAR